MIKQAVIILMGLPASGKTTWAQTNYPGYARLDGDSLKTNDKVCEALDIMLAKGYNCIVDATNGTLVRRHALIQICRKHDVYIFGVQFTLPVNQCIARAKARTDAGGPKVSRVAIYTVNKNFTAPSMLEGFHYLGLAV